MIAGYSLDRSGACPTGASLARRAAWTKQGREPRGERERTECNEVVVEIAALGHDDGGGDASPRATPGGGANAPRLPAESAAAAVMSGAAATADFSK